MRTILWAVLISFSLMLSSFTVFQTSVGEYHCYYEGISVIPSENSGWLVSGAYNSDVSTNEWKSCLVNLDVHGDTISLIKDLPFNGIMKPTPDGNLVFAGGNHAGFVYDTAEVFKVTVTGELIWKKKLFEEYCHHLLTDILVLNDGYLITGIYSQGSCTTPIYDSYIAKLNSSGELVWKYEVKEPGNDQINTVRITKDKKIAAFGWTENKSSSDDADYLLIKLDENGNKIWSKTFGDDRDNFGYGMDITSDNGFVLNGYSQMMEAVRLDENGNLLWSIFLTEACGGKYFKVHSSADGGFVFMGSERRFDECGTVLIKTNSRGEIFWKKNFPGVMRDFIENRPGHFAMTGYKSYLPQLYVVGFDTTSLSKDSQEIEVVNPNEKDIFSVHNTPGNVTSTEEISVKNITTPVVYPNPAVSTVNIDFQNTNHSVYHLDIFDSSGKLIESNQSNNEKFTVESGLLSKSIYTYRLRGDGNIFYGKILFQ